MIDEDRETGIERLKTIYREFAAGLSSLRKKRDGIFQSYEQEIETRVQQRLRQEIDKPSV